MTASLGSILYTFKLLLTSKQNIINTDQNLFNSLEMTGHIGQGIKFLYKKFNNKNKGCGGLFLPLFLDTVGTLSPRGTSNLYLTQHNY